MQQLWNVCDSILRVRMNVATVLVAVGSALMAAFVGVLSQVLSQFGGSTGAVSSQAWLYTNGWIAAVILLLGVIVLLAAIRTYLWAWEMFSIVTRIADYYQYEVGRRWLRQED